MKSLVRQVERVIEPQPVSEGAGVRLNRSIGTRILDYLDPFLLLDHFASRDRRDYEAGFPWHPHRGIETVTYMLRGKWITRIRSAIPAASGRETFSG